MDLVSKLDDNIFLMCRCGECAKCLARAGQMTMDLPNPVSDVVQKVELDQAQMEAARRLLQDFDQFLLIHKMLKGRGAGGISPDTIELYETALAIQAKRFREGPKGWYVVT